MPGGSAARCVVSYWLELLLVYCLVALVVALVLLTKFSIRHWGAEVELSGVAVLQPY